MYLRETLLMLHVRLESVKQAIRAIERLGDSLKEQPAVRKADARLSQALKAQSAGTSVGLAAIGEDTTERLHLATELLQAQKIEGIGRFAGDLAKDFNDILTVIVGYADLSLTELNPSDPIRSYAQEVKIAGVRAASLTQKLLEFSRTQVIAPTVSGQNSPNSRIREDAATAAL
jgi:signal transduction histidine kinase